MADWQSKQQLIDLLLSLVRYPSVTGSEEELALADYIYYLLSEKVYFKENPEYLNLHPLKDGRQLVTALVKKGNKKETIVLLSHFDVVGIDDYGSMKNLAFRPAELTSALKKKIKELPKQVQADLKEGDWLFGRGTMDMKAGLSIHLSMLERAMDDQFDGNILLLSVPDEEVNSFGMLTALPVLNEMKAKYNLDYIACLNGEPIFSQYPGDSNHYLYTGSVGKLLPGFFCYGKETHVGEPFAGLNAGLMNSFLALEMELNESFIEKIENEIAPPPVSLMLRDLKDTYSVQIPVTAISMYNVMYLNQSLEELNAKLLKAAKKAGKAVITYYEEKVSKFSDVVSDFRKPEFEVSVFMYRELYDLAVERYGKEEVERRLNLLVSQREKGDRDFSTLLVQELASLCKDKAPMIVLFYSPPFYPSVSSHEDPYIQRVVKGVKEYTSNHYGIELKEVNFFPGLSDLSYIGPVSGDTKLSDLTTHMPLQGKGFRFPYDVMESITMPILNVGPLGRDPHQWTERLELSYSFESLPAIIHDTIDNLFKFKNSTHDKIKKD